MRPTRPSASWTVATPKDRSRSTSSGSGRVMEVWTMPRSNMLPSFDSKRRGVSRVRADQRFRGGASAALGPQERVETRVNSANVVLEDRGSLVGADLSVIDVADGVIEVVAGFGIDGADRSDHLRSEEDVLRRDRREEFVDARLMIDASIEMQVVQQVLVEIGFAKRRSQAAKASPVVGGCPAAVGDDESEFRVAFEKVTFDQLHHCGGIGIEIVSACGVEGRVDRGRHVNHGRQLVLEDRKSVV